MTQNISIIRLNNLLQDYNKKSAQKRNAQNTFLLFLYQSINPQSDVSVSSTFRNCDWCHQNFHICLNILNLKMSNIYHLQMKKTELKMIKVVPVTYKYFVTHLWQRSYSQWEWLGGEIDKQVHFIHLWTVKSQHPSSQFGRCVILSICFSGFNYISTWQYFQSS